MNTLQINHLSLEEILTTTQLIVNFGLVVLIWMVQLIVYPSFLHYKKENLIPWHQKYTQKITVIVVPLMLFQLALAIYFAFQNLSVTTIISSLTILFLWGFTFTSFAPVHFKISSGKHTQKDLYLLVKRNWWRTFLWSALFIFDVLT